MAKKSTNSGFERQSAIMGQFACIARQGESDGSASALAIAQGVKLAADRAARQARKAAEPRMSFRFLSTGK
jgi:hypothetical protein